MATLTKVATKSEIPVGTGKVVEVGGKKLAVFNCDGMFYVIENQCRHRGGPLGEGTLSGTKVTCPWHGWEYDVTSGSCTVDPLVKVATMQVQVAGEDILVSV